MVSERRASATTTVSGVSTSRTVASGPVRICCTSSRSSVQPLDGVEHRVPRHRHPGGAGQHRPERLHHPALDREHPRHVPAERLRQGEQAQGLSRRRAVDHDTSRRSASAWAAKLEERQHLLGAGDHRQLLGREGVDTGRVEHRPQVALDLAPGALEAALRVDLLDPQPGSISVGSGPRGAAPVPKASPSECAASVDRPGSAARHARRASPYRRQPWSCQLRPCL